LGINPYQFLFFILLFSFFLPSFLSLNNNNKNKRKKGGGERQRGFRIDVFISPATIYLK
jgi:hypothetical protein